MDRKFTFRPHSSERDDSYQYPNNHLLLISIDNYHHVGQLNNAVRDAEAFKELLLEKYQFRSDLVTELYNDDATYDGIDKALRELPHKVKPKENLIIYFSGHGHYDDFKDEGFWIPVDAHFESDREYYPYHYIFKALKKIPSQHTFVIVDSCYSGAYLVENRSAFNSDPREKDPSRWILASGRNEVVPDGKSGENSPFAKQLLAVLNNYCDEGIAVLSLVDKVTTATIHNGKQTPIGRPIQDTGGMGGQFIFRPKISSPNSKTEEEISNPELEISANYEEENILYEEEEEYFDIGLRRPPINERVENTPEEKKIKSINREREIWNSVLANGSEESLEAYLKAYPLSDYADKAIELLSRTRQSFAGYWEITTLKKLPQESYFLQLVKDGALRGEYSVLGKTGELLTGFIASKMKSNIPNIKRIKVSGKWVYNPKKNLLYISVGGRILTAQYVIDINSKEGNGVYFGYDAKAPETKVKLSKKVLRQPRSRR
ncbi:MAG: caspase family protein [Bacteroidota bacterium]